jgi:hypothetical protein
MGWRSFRNITTRLEIEEASMTRTYLQEIATQAIVLSSSSIFLGWYIWAKLAVWPWGASSF